jgi:hypothetical protein
MRNHTRSFLRNMYSTLSSAVAAASAVDRGHRPQDRDLLALGIDPAEFRSIRRYY